jgi:NAD(P)-dependent dehydrogenase (short-subunit alcohol dehydrogenase family)
MDEFQDKVVLITGAGRGKGRALAETFAARGAFVAANDLSPINLDELVARNAGRIKAYTEDVAKKIGVQAVINQVEDDFGQIDILIYHAAVEPRVPLLDMDEWDWHRVLDVNLTGAFLAMQSVGRVMRQRGAGVMINLIAVNRPQVRNEAAYFASMAGLAALTRAAAGELSQFGIHVHAVGRGVPEFHQADPSVPSGMMDAVFYLCTSSLNGQFVNAEAE